jgi:hypothetical protein
MIFILRHFWVIEESLAQHEGNYRKGNCVVLQEVQENCVSLAGLI